MRYTLKILFVWSVFCLSISSCSLLNWFKFGSKSSSKISSSNIGEVIIGWNEMLEQIEQNSNKIEELNNRQFKLTLKLSGEWTLNITPQEALLLTPVEGEMGEFIVKVINAQKLFDMSSGILKRSYIEAKLIKTGGEKGSINLTGAIDCLYDVSFYQINGEKVNFDQISSGHQEEFIISHPDILKQVGKKKDAVTFARPFGDEEEITLSLKLIDKGTSEVYQTPTILIPSCNKVNPTQADVKRMVRKADQCLVHLKGGSKVFNDSSLQFKALEVFANNCSEPIECKMVAKYGVISKSSLKKVYQKEFIFTIGGLEFENIDTSYMILTKSNEMNVNFDSKIYSIPTMGRASVPQGALSLLENSQESDFIHCQFK